MSSAAFTVASLYEAVTSRGNYWIATATALLALFLLLFAAYKAWHEQYVRNSSGPDVILDYKIYPDALHSDFLVFTNQGTSRAFNIAAEDFSAGGPEWHQPIQLPSLDVNEKRTVPAVAYFQVAPGYSEFFHMRNFLGESIGKTLSLPIVFTNIQGVHFRRMFHFSLVFVESKPEIACTPGQISRLKSRP